MRELSVCSTAIGTNEGPEICTDILWSQIVAVDAPLVGGQLEQPAYDPLVPLVLLEPARHRRPDPRPPLPPPQTLPTRLLLRWRRSREISQRKTRWRRAATRRLRLFRSLAASLRV